MPRRRNHAKTTAKLDPIASEVAAHKRLHEIREKGPTKNLQIEQKYGGVVLLNLPEVESIGFQEKVIVSRRARIDGKRYPFLSVVAEEGYDLPEDCWVPIHMSTNSAASFISDVFTIRLMNQCHSDLMVTYVKDGRTEPAPIGRKVPKGFREVVIGVCFKPKRYQDNLGVIHDFPDGYNGDCDLWKMEFMQMLKEIVIEVDEAKDKAILAKQERDKLGLPHLIGLETNVNQPEIQIDVDQAQNMENWENAPTMETYLQTQNPHALQPPPEAMNPPNDNEYVLSSSNNNDEDIDLNSLSDEHLSVMKHIHGLLNPEIQATLDQQEAHFVSLSSQETEMSMDIS